MPVVAAPQVQGQIESHAALALLLLLGVVCVLDAAIIGALLTPIKNHFGLSDEQVGRISALFTFASLIGAPVFGYFANRYGRKPVLLAGVVLWSLSSIATGLTEGFVTLLIWRVLTGFGEAAYNGITPGWLADLYRPKWRNLVFSLYMLRNKIGQAAALALGAWLAAEYGWRTAFFVAGVPGLVLAFGLLFVREPAPGESDGASNPVNTNAVSTNTTDRPARLSLREGLKVFRHPAYVLHISALLLFMTAMTAQLWIPAFLHRAYAVPNRDAANFLAQVLLYTLPAGLIGGYFSSLWLRQFRWGFPAFLSVTSLLAALAYGVAYSVTDLGLSQTLIVAAIASFGLSAGTLTTLIVETVPARLRTSAVAYSVVLTSGVAGIVGPELIGILSDAYGLRVGILVAPASYLGASLIWLVLVFWFARQPAAVPISIPTPIPAQKLNS
jgi:MFS family permease